MDSFEKEIPRRYYQQYYMEHREEILERVKRYNAEHAEDCRRRTMEWREKNHEKYNAYMREYMREYSRRRRRKEPA